MAIRMTVCLLIGGPRPIAARRRGYGRGPAIGVNSLVVGRSARGWGAPPPREQGGPPLPAVTPSAGRHAPVCDPASREVVVRAEVRRRRQDSSKTVVKEFGSVDDNADVAQWLRERNVDTVTLVGYMTNNCVFASAVEGEVLGFSTE